MNLTDEERAARGARLKAARKKGKEEAAPSAAPVLVETPSLIVETADPSPANPCEEKARVYIRHQIDIGQGIDREAVAEILGAEIWDARKFITAAQDAIADERKPRRAGRPSATVTAAIHSDDDSE